MWMKDRFGGEFEVVLSPQRNSMSFLKDRLWKERPLGLKTIGNIPLTTSFRLKQQKQWWR